MKVLNILALFLCVAVSISSSEVLVGDVDNFDELITKNPYTLVEFYAPWCGHCQRLEPEYEKASEILKKADPPVVLIKVDASNEENRPLATKYDVQGFPTLKLFKGDTDSPVDFNGPRDADGIADYVQKKLQPAHRQINDETDFNILKDDQDAVYGLFKDADSKELKAFVSVSESLSEDASFGYSYDNKITNDAKNAAPLIRYFKDKTHTFEYKGDFSVKDIKQWVSSRTLPIYLQYDQTLPNFSQYLGKMFNSENPKFILLSSADDSNVDDDVKDFALKHFGDNHVLIIPGKEQENALEYFGIKQSELPAFIIETQGAKYASKNVKAGTATSFWNDWKAGKVEKSIKSAEVPESNDGPVTVVVGKTFDEIVMGKKDVLLEIYAPWCGHCKKLEPIFNELGAAFEHDDDIIIAKLDGTANDIPSPDVEVAGYPTLVLVTSANKVIPFAGNRNKESLVKFIEENASRSKGSDHSEL